MIPYEELPLWDLSDIYQGTHDPHLEKDIQHAVVLARKFEKLWRGSLAKKAQNSSSNLLQALQEYEKIKELIERISSFAYLLYQSDTMNTQNAIFYGNVCNTMAQAHTHMVFFPLEIALLTDNDISSACTQDNLPATYRALVEDLGHGKKHHLDEKLEKLFEEKRVNEDSWTRLFDETSASMEFDIDGEILILEQAWNKLSDADESTRKKAAFALAKTCKRNVRLFTLIMNTRAKEIDISNRWRSFDGVADFRHLGNKIEPEEVEALTQAVKACYTQTSHRYYRIKAKWVGKKKLDYWDFSAPVGQEKATWIPWEQAKKTVLSAYGAFSPEMEEIAHRFFDRQWIDAGIRKGKAAGAFAHPAIPCLHPYILMNYSGKPGDVMTLAHELGHGIHQVLAREKGILMSEAPPILAETASIFGEMLTFRLLCQQASNAQEYRILLAQKIEDMINTIIRQIALYEFEITLHQERRKGELSSERIGELWSRINNESRGGNIITKGEGFENFWIFVPHFIHCPFYVYAYAFGNCLTNCLYAAYLETGEDFVKNYLDLLKAGKSRNHKELLAPFSLDTSDPSLWLKGLSLLENMIDELEKTEFATSHTT